MRARLLHGALAGVGATLTMSAAMAAGRRAGLMRTPPPQEITRRGLRKSGVPVSHSDAGRLAWPAHLAYGAAMGALFAGASGALPEGPPVVAGVAFGLGVWAASYIGMLPTLGLMPPPQDDSRGRQATMVAAHFVYGATLDALMRTNGHAWGH
jgi:hypothetical protein